MAEAYALYSLAAGLEPQNKSFWQKSQAVRRRAAEQATMAPAAAVALETAESTSEPLSAATPADLLEARKLLPPPELKAKDLRNGFSARGEARALFEQVAKAYGLDVVFDGDYPRGSPLTFTLEDADYREALRALESLTGSFAVPLSEKLIIVAKDTQQKRQDLEPAVSVTIPIPDPVTLQEAQELARSVQQVMEIKRFGIDSARRLVVISDRISKVRPAQRLFEDLAGRRPEVAVEVRFVEVSRSKSLNLGLTLPNSATLYHLPKGLALPQIAGRLVTIGGGSTMFGVGILSGALTATLNKSNSKTLLDTLIRSGDGMAASFHVGDRYPILSAGYFGSVNTTGATSYSPPPSFTFEDLGLVVKITPKIHGPGDVSLAIEAEFKVLAGGGINGIPIIANRKLASQVRLKTEEWGLVAGLMSVSEARTISGLAGLSYIPGLGFLMRQNTRDDQERNVLILLRPHVISLPAAEKVTRTLWVGPEGRLRVPL